MQNEWFPNSVEEYHKDVVVVIVVVFCDAGITAAANSCVRTRRPRLRGQLKSTKCKLLANFNKLEHFILDPKFIKVLVNVKLDFIKIRSQVA